MNPLRPSFSATMIGEKTIPNGNVFEIFQSNDILFYLLASWCSYYLANTRSKNDIDTKVQRLDTFDPQYHGASIPAKSIHTEYYCWQAESFPGQMGILAVKKHQNI